MKRAFTFEELQSGTYINNLDESDLQFYAMYGQPVDIPFAEDSVQEWSLQGQPHNHNRGDSSLCSTAGIHYNPHAFQAWKSYTLVGSLGDLSASTPTQAPSVMQNTRVSATPTHEFQRYSPSVETHTSSSFSPHTTAFLGTSHRDASEVPMIVPSQSHAVLPVVEVWQSSTYCLFT